MTTPPHAPRPDLLNCPTMDPPAADLIITGMDGPISARTVTFDFHRMMENATKLKCSEFSEAIVKHMGCACSG